MQANWTDGEGYYRTRVGEMIENRYKVLGTIGQGVFSTVLKCLDTQEGNKEVALKMIRANDTMRKVSFGAVVLKAIDNSWQVTELSRSVAYFSLKLVRKCFKLLHVITRRRKKRCRSVQS